VTLVKEDPQHSTAHKTIVAVLGTGENAKSKW